MLCLMGRPMKFLREYRLLLLAATNREGGGGEISFETEDRTFQQWPWVACIFVASFPGRPNWTFCAGGASVDWRANGHG